MGSAGVQGHAWSWTAQLTPTCTPAGSTSGTPPHRSPWPGPPACTRAASTAPRCATTVSRPAAARPARLPTGARRLPPRTAIADHARHLRRGPRVTDTPDYQLTQLRDARGRVDPHHPRGGRRARAPRAAVLRRQGLDRDAAPGAEGVPPGPDPVPGACTSTPATTSPRCSTSATSGSTSSGVQLIVASRAGGDRQRHRAARSRTAPATGSRRRCCSTRSRSTASPRCSAAPAATRTRPAPRSGSSPSATSSASGTRRTSAPSCGTSTTAGSTSASQHPGLPAVELDRARHLAVHRARRASRSRSHLLRPRARGVRARRHALRGQRVHAAAADEEVVRDGGARYRTVGDANLTAAVRSDADTVEEVIAEVAATRITERGATRGDDKVSEAAMEDRKREGYF